MRILVLGGAGFVGRHVVAALMARGHEIVVGTRHPARAARRLPPAAANAERRAVHFERLLAPPAWAPLLAGVDTVVNCVGILRPRGRETYERVHHLAPAALADACVAVGIGRLVHVSALGLRAEAASGFLHSKLRGERALRARALDCMIVRPSLLDGPRGFGACWLRRVAAWPVHLVPADAVGRTAPLQVADLGAAIARLCELPAHPTPREVELGGNEVRTMAQHLAALRAERCRRPAKVIHVPPWLARLASHLCDALHFSPFSFGHLELMRKDNVPGVNALPLLLGRAPCAVGLGAQAALDAGASAPLAVLAATRRSFARLLRPVGHAEPKPTVSAPRVAPLF